MGGRRGGEPRGMPADRGCNEGRVRAIVAVGVALTQAVSQRRQRHAAPTHHRCTAQQSETIGERERERERAGGRGGGRGPSKVAATMLNMVLLIAVHLASINQHACARRTLSATPRTWGGRGAVRPLSGTRVAWVSSPRGTHGRRPPARGAVTAPAPHGRKQ